tara:strand:+ start:335 stop:574 length:240 start_codon:yes stop_codon:yes gene_type:complete
MQNNKLTHELLKSLRRIADGIEQSNKLEESAQKRNAKFDKIQEKKAALELKDLQEKRKIGEVTKIIKEELGNNSDGELL